MGYTLLRTCRSPILNEARDFVTGLYDDKGHMLEQAEYIPVLAFALQPVCRKIIEYFGEDIDLGDIICTTMSSPAETRTPMCRYSSRSFIKERSLRGPRSRGTRPTSAAQSAVVITPTRPKSGRRHCAFRRSRSTRRGNCARTFGSSFSPISGWT